MAATRLDWIDSPQAEGRVAVLTLDLPGKSANLLGSAVLDEIEARLDEVDAASSVAGLVFDSAKPGVFIAGADLTEFAAGLDRPKDDILATTERGQTLFGRLVSCDYPTIAAIDGVCVGGGLELAVWCDRRVATASSKTQFAFPEVKLGLLPGWGGTARTPRMIGLANAIESVTSGDSLGASDAFRLGLVDDVVERRDGGDAADGDQLLAASLRMVAAEQSSGDYRSDRERWSAPIPQSETELAFLGATAAAVIQQKTGGHYPAPMAALELMLEASQLDLEAALVAEREAFAPLFGSPVNRALLNVFFLTDRAKKGGRPADDSPSIATVGVVGAGIMGQGIAAVSVKRGVRVLLSDSRPEALARGVEAVVREASFDKVTKGVSAELAIARGALVSPAADAETLGAADLVVEAIVEDAGAKQDLFAAVEPRMADDAILATNTSTIPVTKLAERLERPERFAGLHFFNPVRKMPLIEVIRGAETSDATIDRLVAYSKRLGKTPVVVNDGPGFLVNRLLLPYMNEAALLAEEGVPIKKIDRAAKAFGMPMGPLELHDVVGLDTCLHAGRVMHAAFGDRIAPAGAIDRLVDAGRLGQKSGGGFYDWKPGKAGKPPKGSPSAHAETLAKTAGDGQPAERIASLEDRLLLPMLIEATRALEDGIVGDPRDVDLALILGIGFPPHRGGLFFWADRLGKDELLDRLSGLESLGPRFQPTALLREPGPFLP